MRVMRPWGGGGDEGMRAWGGGWDERMRAWGGGGDEGLALACYILCFVVGSCLPDFSAPCYERLYMSAQHMYVRMHPYPRIRILSCYSRMCSELFVVTAPA